jgi:HSP20 family molecular chaperone IbpA
MKILFLVKFLQSNILFSIPKISEHEINTKTFSIFYQKTKKPKMSYIVLRRPNFNFFEEEFFTPTIFQAPRRRPTFSIQRRNQDSFEDLFSTFEKSPKQQEKEIKKNFEFEMNLSERISIENIQVKVINGNLKIETSFKDENSFESYSKQISIPKGFDVEKISAKLKSGKLFISIPRIENNLIEKNVEIQIVENVKENKETPILGESKKEKETEPLIEESKQEISVEPKEKESQPLGEEELLIEEIKENEKEPLLQVPNEQELYE